MCVLICLACEGRRVPYFCYRTLPGDFGLMCVSCTKCKNAQYSRQIIVPIHDVRMHKEFLRTTSSTTTSISKLHALPHFNWRTFISWKLKRGCASVPVHGFHESHGTIIVSAVFCSCLALAIDLVLSASSSSLLAPPSGNFGPWSTKTLSDSVEKNGWNIQWRWKNTSWKMHRIMIEIDILLFFMDRYFVVFFVARWVPKIPLTC